MLDTSTGQTVQALLDAQLVSAGRVTEATEAAERSGRTPLQELLDAGLVDRDEVVRTAATAAGLRYVEVAEYSMDASAAALLPADFARRSSVLPLTWEDGELLVAIAGVPSRVGALMLVEQPPLPHPQRRSCTVQSPSRRLPRSRCRPYQSRLFR